MTTRAFGGHPAEFLQKNACPVQVRLDDGRRGCLGGRDARRIHHVQDRREPPCLLEQLKDGFAAGEGGYDGAALESRILQNVSCAPHGLQFQARKNEMPSGAVSADNGLPD